MSAYPQNSGMAIANAVGLGAVLCANGVFGWRLAKTSARNDTPFTPARPAFAIWSLIYPLLIAAVVAQFFDDRVARALDVAFLVHCAGTIAWLYMFTSDHVKTASLFLVVTTVAVGVCYGRVQAWRTMTTWPSVVATIAFSIFFGWSLLAAVLNLSIAVRAPSAVRLPVWLVLFAVVLAVQCVTLDPLLSLPLAWGALNRAMRGDPIAYVFGLLFLGATVGVASGLTAVRDG